MKITYKREDHKSFLVILPDLKDITEEAAFSMTMLIQNPMDGLLKMEEKIFNGESSIYYDISGKQSISVLYERKLLDGDALSEMFKDLKGVYRGLSLHLVDTEGIILNPEYIFLDANQKRYYFLYYPGIRAGESGSDLAEYLLDRIADKDENAVMQAYEFYRLVKEEDGDVAAAVIRMETEIEKERIKKHDDIEKENEKEDEEFYFDEEPSIDEKDTDYGYGKEKEENYDDEASEKGSAGSIKRERHVPIKALAAFSMMAVAGAALMLWCAFTENAPVVDLVSVREFAIGAGLVLTAFVGSIAMLITGRRGKKGKKKSVVTDDEEDVPMEKTEPIYDDEDVFFEAEDVREETYDSDDGEDDQKTMLIDDNIYREQRILSGKIKGKKREIDLADFPFVVGKNREQVDLCIDDRSVSRVHARFTLRDDIVFLTDMNSLNGTYKNGIRLEPNELVALEREDEIRFGRCSFIYL